MNQAYRLIWSASAQAWVVASELAKSHKKSTAKTLWLAISLGLVPLQGVWADPPVRAIPVLTNIAAGTASVTSNAATGRVTVDQSSAKLIANWQSFNVGEQSRVTFNQPDASSIALNRIAATAASEVFGRVTANGQLILVNPAGLVFGPASQVSASSVIASTLNITDTNFNAGNLIFDRGTATGEVNNQGTILALAGNTTVLAPSIKNSGTIRAKSGNVVLANGNRLTVDNTSVTLNQVSGIPGLIQSSGILRADRLESTKGKVFLVGDRARAASLVELEGALTAISADIKGRQVYVTGNLDSIANTSLNAVNSINIDGAINILSNNRLVSFAHGVAAGEGYYLGLNGTLNLTGVNTKFRVNNEYYTIIKTLSQLQAVGADAGSLAGKYVLGVDIDASSTAVSSFNPVGSTAANPFIGVLDGLGHRVSSLTMNKPTLDAIGLFGYTLNAKINNLKLENANIIGRNYVGGVVGIATTNEGASVFINNHVTGVVKGKNTVGGLIAFNSNNNGSTSIKDSSSNANVSGYTNVGGLVGQINLDAANVLVEQSHVDGTTQVVNIAAETKQNIGGLIGLVQVNAGSQFNLNNSQVAGAVSSTRLSSYLGGAIGQIVSSYGGASSITIDQVQTGGAVSNTSTSSSTGGLIGGVALQGGNRFDLIDSSASGAVSGGSSTGGLIGGASAEGAGAATELTLNHSYASGDVSGSNNVGGLIGATLAYGDGALLELNNGTYAAGNVNGQNQVGGLIGSSSAYYNGEHRIVDSYATGNVSSGDLNSATGGLIGRNDSYFGLTNHIDNSHASGNVTGGSNVGGLIGTNTAGDGEQITISNSYAVGIVDGETQEIGGLVGLNVGKIENSYATGAVNTGINGSYVGGLVGHAVQSVLTNNYSTGNLTGGAVGIGGLIGYGYENNITGSHSSGVINSSATNVGGLVGLNYFTPIQNSYATGNVSATSGFGVGGLVGYNYDSAISDSHSTGNITAYGDVGGLIGTNQINSGVAIVFDKNYATGSVEALWSNSAGGLIGSNQVTGSLTINRNYASGNVVATAASFVGGLIGYHNSNAADSLFQLNNTFASGTATGNDYIGGLIGGIENQNGVVNIVNTYAKGNVSGLNTLGGLIGYVNDTTGTTNISNSYWDTTNSNQTVGIGNANVHGVINNLTGRTAAQMKQASSFVGWNISSSLNGSSSIWYINQNVNTPQLRALLP